MNAAHMMFRPHEEGLRSLIATLKDRRQAAARAANGAKDWDTWWESFQQESGLSDLFAERDPRFGWRDRQWTRPSFEFRVASLREAGFREVGVIWQWLDNRILLAIR